MNEEAIKVAYDLLVADGYTKSIDDFKLLMDSNEEAVKVAYDLFVADGYTKSIEDFKGLVKKKKMVFWPGKIRLPYKKELLHWSLQSQVTTT